MESSLVLVLDFDGVLVDLGIDWVKVRMDVSQAVGREIDSLNTFWEAHFGTDEFEVASGIAERYEMEAVAKVEPQCISELKKALEKTRDSSRFVVCYVASLQSEAALKNFLDSHKLGKYFKEVLGRCSYGSKRNQLDYIMKQAGNTEKLVMIDDSMAAQRLCNELGIRCIHFSKEADDIESVITSVLMRLS